MRKLVHGAWMLGLAVAVAGCASATASTAGISPSAATAAPLGMLPIPPGATAWTANTNAPMSLVSYINKFYNASSWTQEKSQYTRRGFVSGAYEGWISAGGSQQRIAIARFATANGAISAYDDLKDAFAGTAAPATTFADPAVGGAGSVEPKLDSNGNALVDIVARVGDLLVDVHELTAATPDPAAAKALILSQVKALKSAAATSSAVSTPSAASAPSAASSAAAAGAAGPLGMLSIPLGATPWTENTGAPMSLDSYTDQFWNPSAQSAEKSQYAQWGFASGGIEGWISLDGSQQKISIARFATANGAISAFDDLRSALTGKPKPWTAVNDSADGAVGAVNPQLDSLGNALVDITARVGDYLVDVHEYTAATPDPAAARALLREQVDALKNGA